MTGEMLNVFFYNDWEDGKLVKQNKKNKQKKPSALKVQKLKFNAPEPCGEECL